MHSSTNLQLAIIFILITTFDGSRHGNHRNARERAKHDGMGGCVYDQPYDRSLAFPVEAVQQRATEAEHDFDSSSSSGHSGPWDSVWIEKLPSQTILYDKYGNIVQRVHHWETGCRMVVERCTLQDNVCAPGSGQKWRFGGCSWASGSVCEPKKDDRLLGKWEQWPP